MKSNESLHPKVQQRQDGNTEECQHQLSLSLYGLPRDLSAGTQLTQQITGILLTWSLLQLARLRRWVDDFCVRLPSAMQKHWLTQHVPVTERFAGQECLVQLMPLGAAAAPH
jgi:hypothetical protein